MQVNDSMAKKLPFVTVVMPVRNESAFIERSLGAVWAQDYPPERYEVIVADGLSTDGTLQWLQNQQASAQSRLKIVTNHGRIAPTGLNAAIAQARGDIIVRVDGHCEIAPDYVRRCVAHLQNAEVDGVGGPLETIGQTPLAQAIACAMSSPFGIGNSAFRTVKGQTMLTDTVAFPAYTRAAIERAGPYDEELVRNQDDEYNYRLRKLGGRILLAADVRARYYSRGNLRSLLRQYFQYGVWKVRVLQKHPRQMSGRQFVPPLFVTTLLTLSSAALISSLAAWLLTAVVLSYAAANGLATILTARRCGWQLAAYFPIIFPTLHLSYGVGFLVGLFRFAPRW
jgi:succinoglycan biosynthesis protein ExoA